MQPSHVINQPWEKKVDIQSNKMEKIKKPNAKLMVFLLANVVQMMRMQHVKQKL